MQLFSACRSIYFSGILVCWIYIFIWVIWVWKISAPSVKWEEQYPQGTITLRTREDGLMFLVHCPAPRGSKYGTGWAVWSIELFWWSLLPDKSPFCLHVLIKTQGLYLRIPTATTAMGRPLHQQQDFLTSKDFNSRTSTHINSKWCRTVAKSWGEGLQRFILKAQPAATERAAWLEKYWSELEVWARWCWRGPPQHVWVQTVFVWWHKPGWEVKLTGQKLQAIQWEQIRLSAILEACPF